MPRFLRVTLITAVALAAADSAIVVLAVPQLLAHFGQSIPSTAWVVTAYNLAAAIAETVVVIAASRLRTRRLLTVGLLVFADCDDRLRRLDLALDARRAARRPGCRGSTRALRSVRRARPRRLGGRGSPIRAAALARRSAERSRRSSDWRANFVAQAPVALVAVAAALRSEDVPLLILRPRPCRRDSGCLHDLGRTGRPACSWWLSFWLRDTGSCRWPPPEWCRYCPSRPSSSGGGSRQRPSQQASSHSRLGSDWFSIAPGSIAVNVVALVACGAGLGVCLPPTSQEAGITGVASRHAGIRARAAAARPKLSDDLSHNADAAKTKGIVIVLKAPFLLLDKIPLTINLYRALRASGHGKLPDFTSAFEKARRDDASAVPKLDALQQSLDRVQQDVIAMSFKRPFAVAAILFALLALVPLAAGRVVAVARLPA